LYALVIRVKWFHEPVAVGIVLEHHPVMGRLWCPQAHTRFAILSAYQC
jgi:hypothetical protein